MSKPFMIVATPYLKDLTGFFDKTILVIVPEEDGGHRGFTINKHERTPFQGVPGAFMSLAGPQDWQRPYGFLATGDWAWDGLREGGVTIGLDQDILRLVDASEAGEGPSKQLICFGLANWGPGQLESEMYDRFDWFKIDLKAENVFADNIEGLWTRLVQEQGHDPAEYEKTMDPGFIIEQAVSTEPS